MTQVELRYWQKLAITYTALDGTEKMQIVEAQWLKEMSCKTHRKIAFKKKFPFIDVKRIEYTDVLLNAGTDAFPNWMHIRALESQKLMAKKFGIDCQDVFVEQIDDDLGL